MLAARCERVSSSSTSSAAVSSPSPLFLLSSCLPAFLRAFQFLQGGGIKQEDFVKPYLSTLPAQFLLCPWLCPVCKTLLVVERGGYAHPKNKDTKKATKNRNQIDLGRGSKARDGPHFLMAPGQTWRAASSNISMHRQSTVGGRRAESSKF